MRKLGALLAGLAMGGFLLVANEPYAQRDEQAQSAPAQGQSVQGQSAQTQTQAPVVQGQEMQSFELLRASKAVGQKVQDSTGKTIGKIEELVADSGMGFPVFAIVSLDPSTAQDALKSDTKTGDVKDQAAKSEAAGTEAAKPEAAKSEGEDKPATAESKSEMAMLTDRFYAIPLELLNPVSGEQAPAATKTDKAEKQDEKPAAGDAEKARTAESATLVGLGKLDHFVLTTDMNRLQTAPSFGKDEWKDGLSSEKASSIYSHFGLKMPEMTGSTGTAMDTGVAMAQTGAVPAGDATGSTLKGSDTNAQSPTVEGEGAAPQVAGELKADETAAKGTETETAKGTETETAEGTEADVAKGTETAATAETKVAEGTEMAAVPAAGSEFVLLSKLAGKPVLGTDGKKLGKIEDLVLDARQSGIAYAVLSFTGVKEAGDKLYAIPWEALSPTMDEKDQITVGLDTARLSGAPIIEKKDWPETAALLEGDRKFLSSIFSFYQVEPYFERAAQPGTGQPSEVGLSGGESLPSSGDTGAVPSTDSVDTAQAGASETSAAVPSSGSETAQTGAANILRASQIIGYTVKSQSGEELGRIEDVVLDPDQGKIAYVVLAYGGFLGMGGKYFALPWEQLTAQAEEEAFTIKLEKEQLESAQGFDKDNWPETAGSLPGDATARATSTTQP